MKSTKILALLLVAVMCFGMLASCNLLPGNKCDHADKNDDLKCDKCGADFDDGKDVEDKPEAPKSYTYNNYLTISPSNWNELTYQDNNDTEVLGWIGSSFFTYDFKYDENGEIVPGEFDVKYSAATNLEDISGEVDAKWGIPAGKTGYAYRITLRDDLKWENGDKITAEDFVYTMKEQLNPLFQNYRADSYYNSAQSLVGAKDYAKQGQSGWFMANAPYAEYTEDLDSKLIFKLAVADPEGEGIETVTGYTRGDWGFPDSYDTKAIGDYFAANYAAYFPNSTGDKWAAMEGKTLAEIKQDPELAPLVAEINAALGILSVTVTEYTFPEASWDNVGIYAESETELVVVFAKALPLLQEDGSIGYKAAYNLSSLPLVHKATYEACKIAPTEGSTLWTSKYNSSVETTMSWGPYKLESFQTGSQFTLVKNDNWYGYGLEENEGLYQTTRIVYDIVADWNSAWIKFQAGELDGIGIDVSIADDYKNSEQAFFTPSDFVSSLQLQSSATALKERGDKEGVNKMLMAYPEFRKALSLSINRAEFAQTCTTSSKAGFGLFNSMHYYDVENGGVFRNSDEAKQVLCNIYGVDVSKYDSLDDAVNAITGYDLELARSLVVEAYNKALDNGDITATDKVKFTFGTGSITEATQRQYDYFAASWMKLVEGTPLEGRLELELVDKGSTWAKDFRAGGYDVCIGGWTGAAWDPGYFLLAYLDKGYMYSSAWDTSNTMMTFTMKGVGENGADITETMSLTEWYDCLNGNDGCKYDWSSNALPEAKRLQLIAALEQEVLKVYYTVPVANSFSASLISYQVDYVTYEYNTFMGYGGVKYMTYNYDDAAWDAMVKAEGGELNYKN